MKLDKFYGNVMEPIGLQTILSKYRKDHQNEAGIMVMSDSAVLEIIFRKEPDLLKGIPQTEIDKVMKGSVFGSGFNTLDNMGLVLERTDKKEPESRIDRMKREIPDFNPQFVPEMPVHVADKTYMYNRYEELTEALPQPTEEEIERANRTRKALEAVQKTSKNVYRPTLQALEILGWNYNTKDGEKISQRLSLIPEDFYQEAELGQALIEMLVLYDLEPTFDNVANVMELLGCSIRTDEEEAAAEEEMNKLYARLMVQNILEYIYSSASQEYDNAYRNIQGSFTKYVDFSYWCNNWNKLMSFVIGDNCDMESIRDYYKQWSEIFGKLNPFYEKEFAAKIKQYKGVNLDEKYRYILDNIEVLQNPQDKRFNEVFENALGFNALKAADKDLMIQNFINGAGDALVMVMTLGLAAELKVVKYGRALAVGQSTAWSSKLAAKGVQRTTKFGRTTYKFASKATKLSGPAVVGGVEIGGYEFVKGTAGNLTTATSVQEFIHNEGTVLNRTESSFFFGFFGGLWGQTAVAGMQKWVTRASAKTTKALSSKMAEQGYVDMSEVVATYLEKSVPGLGAQLTGFATEVVGFSVYESALALWQARDDWDEMSLDDLTNLLWENFKGQGMGLGQIKILSFVLFAKGGRIAQKSSMDYLSQTKEFEGVKVREIKQNGKTRYLVESKFNSIECNSWDEVITSGLMFARAGRAFDELVTEAEQAGIELEKQKPESEQIKSTEPIVEDSEYGEIETNGNITEKFQLIGSEQKQDAFCYHFKLPDGRSITLKSSKVLSIGEMNNALEKYYNETQMSNLSVNNPKLKIIQTNMQNVSKAKKIMLKSIEDLMELFGANSTCRKQADAMLDEIISTKNYQKLDELNLYLQAYAELTGRAYAGYNAFTSDDGKTLLYISDLAQLGTFTWENRGLHLDDWASQPLQKYNPKMDIKQLQTWGSAIRFMKMYPESELSQYFYEIHLNGIKKASPELAARLNNVNQKYGLKIFLPSAFCKADAFKAIDYIDDELKLWIKASGGEVKIPPVIEFNSINKSFHFENVIGFEQQMLNGSIHLPNLYMYSLRRSLRHEITHTNDLKQNEGFTPVSFDDIQTNRKYWNEFRNAGIPEDHIDYAYKNSKEFIAVASEGDMSKYSPEFKELLVALGMPRWELEIPQNPYQDSPSGANAIPQGNKGVPLLVSFLAKHRSEQMLFEAEIPANMNIAESGEKPGTGHQRNVVNEISDDIFQYARRMVAEGDAPKEAPKPYEPLAPEPAKSVSAETVPTAPKSEPIDQPNRQKLLSKAEYAETLGLSEKTIDIFINSRIIVVNEDGMVDWNNPANKRFTKYAIDLITKMATPEPVESMSEAAKPVADINPKPEQKPGQKPVEAETVPTEPKSNPNPAKELTSEEKFRRYAAKKGEGWTCSISGDKCIFKTQDGHYIEAYIDGKGAVRLKKGFVDNFVTSTDGSTPAPTSKPAQDTPGADIPEQNVPGTTEKTAYTIAEFAAKIGVSEQRVRIYAEQGLLTLSNDMVDSETYNNFVRPKRGPKPGTKKDVTGTESPQSPVNESARDNLGASEPSEPHLVTINEFAQMLNISPTNVRKLSGVAFYYKKVNGKTMIDVNCPCNQEIIEKYKSKLNKKDAPNPVEVEREQKTKKLFEDLGIDQICIDRLFGTTEYKKALYELARQIELYSKYDGITINKAKVKENLYLCIEDIQNGKSPIPRIFDSKDGRSVDMKVLTSEHVQTYQEAKEKVLKALGFYEGLEYTNNRIDGKLYSEKNFIASINGKIVTVFDLTGRTNITEADKKFFSSCDVATCKKLGIEKVENENGLKIIMEDGKDLDVSAINTMFKSIFDGEALNLINQTVNGLFKANGLKYAAISEISMNKTGSTHMIVIKMRDGKLINISSFKDICIARFGEDAMVDNLKQIMMEIYVDSDKYIYINNEVLDVISKLDECEFKTAEDIEALCRFVLKLEEYKLSEKPNGKKLPFPQEILESVNEVVTRYEKMREQQLENFNNALQTFENSRGFLQSNGFDEVILVCEKYLSNNKHISNTADITYIMNLVEKMSKGNCSIAERQEIATTILGYDAVKSGTKELADAKEYAKSVYGSEDYKYIGEYILHARNLENGRFHVYPAFCTNLSSQLTNIPQRDAVEILVKLEKWNSFSDSDKISFCQLRKLFINLEKGNNEKINFIDFLKDNPVVRDILYNYIENYYTKRETEITAIWREYGKNDKLQGVLTIEAKKEIRRHFNDQINNMLEFINEYEGAMHFICRSDGQKGIKRRVTKHGQDPEYEIKTSYEQRILGKPVNGKIIFNEVKWDKK